MMKAIPWIGLGLVGLGTAVSIITLVIKSRDRNALQGRFDQYLK